MTKGFTMAQLKELLVFMKTLLLQFLQLESKTWNQKLQACKRKTSN